MTIEAINYEQRAESRITQQHRNKPNFVALVRGLAGLAGQYLEDPATNLYDKLNVDLMGGANLDVIGDIVGQPREVIDYDIIEFFGYDGATGAGTYGDSTNSAIGARYRSETEPETGGNTLLEDPEYRIFIKARILKNYSSSTPEEIREAVKVITGSESVRIDEGVMEMQIGILGPLDATTANIIQNYDIIPRPTGVEITDVYEIPVVISVSGTGTASDNTYDYNGISSSFSSYVTDELVSQRSSISYLTNSWIILSNLTGEFWSIVSSSTIPDKTGWSIGSLGSPAPTLDY